MRLKGPIRLPPVMDMHVHLRQDPAMMALAVDAIEQGGAKTVYVMPNLTPPLTTVPDVVAYHRRLQALNPDVHFLMTLYLHRSLTPATIAEAAATRQPPEHGSGRLIVGVKAYPAGVTTNSAAGVTDLTKFYPIFAAMQEHDMILNLHGEVPGVGVHDAEAHFLPTLADVHVGFPRMRIVLEHVSTSVALQAVSECGPTVYCTITAHHLHLTTKDWFDSYHLTSGSGAAHNWCKPAAKTIEDRAALVVAVVRGGPRVMFGSDSAPHPAAAKAQAEPAAGCFTQGWTAAWVLAALEEGVRNGWLAASEVTMPALRGFLHGHARAFLRPNEGGDGGAVGAAGARRDHSVLVLERRGARVPAMVSKTVENDTVEVVPFGAGRECWSATWADAADKEPLTEGPLEWEGGAP